MDAYTARGSVMDTHIFVISIIEGQRMLDTTRTCDPLVVSISYKTPVMNVMNAFSI